jgi:hypothetical protein
MKAFSGGAGSVALWRRTTPTSGSSGTVSAVGLVPLPLSQAKTNRFKWIVFLMVQCLALVPWHRNGHEQVPSLQEK